MSNILVTGGSGFVGSRIAARLVELGHNVYATSSGGGNDPPGTVLYRGNYGLNFRMLPRVIDAVFHQSANNDTLCTDSQAMFLNNQQQTVMLFNKLYWEFDCRRFIYASSTAVYGDSPAPYIEDYTPTAPLNMYAESKLGMEKSVTRLLKFRPESIGIGFRYCNVYGPGEEYKGRRASMIHQLIRHKLMDRTPKLFTDGSQQRDWVHVDDVVDANILALEAKESDIYNLGTGQPVSFNDLIKIIGIEKVEWVECPFKDKYQSYTCCNLKKIGSRLGYSPKRLPENAIPEYIEYLKQV